MHAVNISLQYSNEWLTRGYLPPKKKLSKEKKIKGKEKGIKPWGKKEDFYYIIRNLFYIPGQKCSIPGAYLSIFC